MTSNLLNQIPLIERTKAFVDKFGCKIRWISEHTNIPNRYLSSWLNGNVSLYAPQLERLTAFLDEYEMRMNGFPYLKDSE